MINKQAMIEEIYNKELCSELEKLGFDFSKFNPKKVLSIIKPAGQNKPMKKVVSKRMTGVEAAKKMKANIDSIRSATAYGRSAYY